MASKKFNDLKDLFIEYEGLLDNIEFCRELNHAGLDSEENISEDISRLTEVESIIEALLV